MPKKSSQRGHSGSKSREGIETKFLSSRSHSAICHSGSKSREGIETCRSHSESSHQQRVTAGRKAEKALKPDTAIHIEVGSEGHSGSKSREGIETFRRDVVRRRPRRMSQRVEKPRRH